jgi:ribosome recycling factor
MKDLRRNNEQEIKQMHAELRTIRKEVDDKIKKALDNPLAEK